MYTPFAASLLGLGAVVMISLLDCMQWWKKRKEKAALATSSIGPVLSSGLDNDVRNTQADLYGIIIM